MDGFLDTAWKLAFVYFGLWLAYCLWRLWITRGCPDTPEDDPPEWRSEI